MATINNSNLTKELVDGAKIAIAYEKVPDQIADKVVPVMEVNPKLLRVADIVRNYASTSTGTANAVNLPTDSDFYLTSFSYSMVKNATCDVATGGSVFVSVTIGGVARILGYISCLTLTAQDSNISNDFTVPIKLDKGSSITISGNFAAGAMSRTLNVAGYQVYNASV